MYCFDCIFISRSNLTYWIPISVCSLVSYLSISCSTCFKSTKSMRPNGNINTKWAKVLYLFGKKYFLYQSQVFLLISFLGTFFKLLELSRFITLLYRSSRPEVFCKKCVLENSAKFTELHLCQSLFFNKVEACNFIKKETLGQVFSCEFC